MATLVAGVPSMHICLDFVPELLQQSQPSQQLFGIELASQLCLHYSLPKSLSIARLCVNVIATLITGRHAAILLSNVSHKQDIKPRFLI